MLIEWLPKAWRKWSRKASLSTTSRKRNLRQLAPLSPERLEDRALLSATGLTDSSGISSVLTQIATNSGTTGGTSGIVDTTSSLVARDNAGRVGVRITSSNPNLTASMLGSLGFVTTGIDQSHNFVEGFLPANKINQLSSVSGTGMLGVVPIFSPKVSAGSVDDQASLVLESDRVNNTLPVGYDGTGVRIGILSDSFNQAGGPVIPGVATGDLPSDIKIIKEGVVGSADEGRAMGELIHDVAPGASLSFASAFYGEAAFAQSIRDLANPALGRASIIVDDIGYFAEPFFQDGIINQAIDDVTKYQGVTYFSAAGNDASNSYENVSPNFTTDNVFNGQFLDFDPSTNFTDTRNQMFLAPGATTILSLQWDDPFYTTNGVDTDLDLLVVDSFTGSLLFSATTNNIATQVPNEIVGFKNTTGNFLAVDIMVRLDSGPAPGRIKWVDYGTAVGNNKFLQYDTQSSTIIGHAAAKTAISTAAINYLTPEAPELFTSAGPTTMLFSPSGARLGVPDVRSTPTLASIDGTDTSFFTGDILDLTGTDTERNGSPNFYGTSAAAPHAAAVAALVKQANPGFTPAQIKQRLLDSTTDVVISTTDTGVDNLTGAGLINAYRAVNGGVTTGSLNYFDSFETGSLGSTWETNNLGGGSAVVTRNIGASDGTFSTQLQSVYDNADANSIAGISTVDPNNFFIDDINGVAGSLSEAVLNLDLSSSNLSDLSQDVYLTFDAKQLVGPLASGQNDLQQRMSPIFVDHEASDGVAISTDGGTYWYRLLSLTDSQISDSFSFHRINISQFAREHGLPLNSDVQIKFQEFDKLADIFTFFGGTFISFNPPIKANITTGSLGTLLPIATNGIALDNIKVFTNTAPTISAGVLPVSYRLGAPAVQVSPDGTISEPENPDFDGGSLVVAITNNGTSSDRLEIFNQGLGLNQFSLSGNRILYSGSEIGSFTGGSLSQPLAILFNGNATPTIVQGLLRDITFRTTSSSLLSRTLQFTLTDSQGAVSTPATKVISIQAGGNVAPEITLQPASLNVSRKSLATPLDTAATLVDTDSVNFAGGVLTFKISSGLSTSDRLEVRNQGNGSGQIGVSGSTIKYQNQIIGTLTGSPGNRSITLNSNATVAAVQALIQNLTFRTISSTAPLGSRTVQIQVTDGDGGTSAVASKVVNVVKLNASPVLGITSTIPVYHLGSISPVIIESAATVTDSDSLNFNGGKLTVQITANSNISDRLAIRNQGPSVGQISVQGTSVLFGGLQIGTFTGGTGNSALVITLNANATASATRALMRNITFQTGGTNPSLLQRSISFQLSDGTGGTSATVTKYVNVSAT